jgi:aminopeptidase N
MHHNIMKMNRFWIILALSIAAGAVTAQDSTYYQSYVQDPLGSIRNHNVDMQHLTLELRFQPKEGRLEGLANYTFRPLQQRVDTLLLDAPGIAVKNVTVDGALSRFRTDSAGLTIYFTPSLEWETTHTLQIDYSATPKKGIYFVGWNVNTDEIANDPDRIRKQIWTQGQGTDNRFWIPSYDDVNDKLITELIVYFDPAYEVLSNGNLKSTRIENDGTVKRWHYAMEHPHANYLIMLGIGAYRYEDYTSKNGIVSRQYYYPDRRDCVAPTYAYSAEMMDWIAQETGVPYPWSTYANIPVQEFLYGAMENTTAAIFTDAVFQDAHAQPDQSYVSTNAHELAHQWFGDYVTEWSGTEHWLQESFATHYSKKFMQSIEGDDAFQWRRRQEMLNAINADSRDAYPLAHSEAGSARHYPKGSFVLDMMRYVLGNEAYRKVVKEYLEGHAYDNVRSGDLEIQCMRTLGVNMAWFFDQWVYRSGFPVLQIAYSTSANDVELVVEQMQEITATQGYFRMPVTVQVHYTDGNYTEQQTWMDGKQTTISIPRTASSDIAFVLFDPGTQILSKVQFDKPFAELRLQAFNAPLMIDRYDAVAAMREMPLDIKRTDLQNLYDREAFYGIRQEIIAQLANDTDKKSLQLLQRALKDEDTRIRRQVVASLDTLPKKLEKDLTVLLEDNNYQTVETALRQLTKLAPEKTDTWLKYADGQMGANKNIRIAYLELSLMQKMNKAAAAELTSYCSNLYEFRTRQNAMGALSRIPYCDDVVVANMLDAYQSFNRRLVGVARRALQSYLDNEAYAVIVREGIATAIAQGGDAERLQAILE